MAFAQSLKRAFHSIVQREPQLSQQTQAPAPTQGDGSSSSANVIPLRGAATQSEQEHQTDVPTHGSGGLEEVGAMDDFAQVTAGFSKAVKFPGYLDCPEIKGFLSQGFFGYGRHNGVRYPTKNALESGKAALIANFSNQLDSLIEKSHTKKDALELQRIDVAGVCPDVAARIDVAVRQIDRGIKLLESQKAEAAHERGWIAGPLRDYEAGFTRGARDAVDFSRFEI